MTRQCSVLKERMWRERLDRYHQRGVSVAALCAAEGVSLAAFYCWQRRLREVAGPECGPQVATSVGRDAAVRDHAALVVLVVVWAPEDEVWIEVPGSVVAGLVAGSLTTYIERREDANFYEINPAIDRFAQNKRFFTYLANSRERQATSPVVLGDARLKLCDALENYGLLLLEAFTSDAIPVHLLTKEAIVEYFAKLQPTEVMACHISNLHVDLEPVLANIDSDLGDVADVQEDHRLSFDERRRGKNPSSWLVIALPQDTLELVLRSGPWLPCRPRPTLGVWTDDQSNLLSAVR